MATSATTPAVSLELVMDKCSRTYGEGGCKASLVEVEAREAVKNFSAVASWDNGNPDNTRENAVYDSVTNELKVSANEKTGALPSEDNRTYRLTRSGGRLAEASVEGSIRIQPEDATTNTIRFQVGDNADMIAAFEPVPYELHASWEQGNVNFTNKAYFASAGSDSGYVVVNETSLSGALPTNTSGKWRLRRSGGGIDDREVVGTVTIEDSVTVGFDGIARFMQGDGRNTISAGYYEPNDPNGGRSFICDSGELYGAQPPNNNDHFTRQTAGVLTTDWQQIGFYSNGNFVRHAGNWYRAKADITPNSQPATVNMPPPNAAWTALTTPAWSSENTYAANDYVVFNGNLYRANNAITPPVTEQARWNAGHESNAMQARYFDNASQRYLCVNNTEVSGDFPTNISGTWRLRHTGGGSTMGALTTHLDLSNFICIRVGSASDMAAAFSSDTINSGGQWILERVTGTIQNPANDSANWTAITTPAWSASSGYAINDVVINNNVYYRANTAITGGFTEIGRWNDTSANYRTAGETDYTNFGGATACFNRNPLNNVADPFPLNTANTYRLRYVQGGSATQSSAQITGTPTQAHIDTSPGGGIACYRFGTSDDMRAAFGNPVSNPNSPSSFNGGQWILEEMGASTVPNNPPNVDTTRWTLIPAWNATTAYNINDFVHFSDMIYFANQAVVSNTLGTGTYQLQRSGGGQPDAVVSGNLIIKGSVGAATRISVGSESAMHTAFNSGVPANAGFSQTGKWTQGSIAREQKAYYENGTANANDIGHFIYNIVGETGNIPLSLTGTYKLRRRVIDALTPAEALPEVELEGAITNEVVVNTTSVNYFGRWNVAANASANGSVARNSAGNFEFNLTPATVGPRLGSNTTLTDLGWFQNDLNIAFVVTHNNTITLYDGKSANRAFGTNATVGFTGSPTAAQFPVGATVDVFRTIKSSAVRGRLRIGTLQQMQEKFNAGSPSPTNADAPAYDWFLELANTPTTYQSTPEYVWSLGRQATQKRIRVDSAAAMNMAFSIGKASPDNADTPNFNWLLEREYDAQVEGVEWRLEALTSTTPAVEARVKTGTQKCFNTFETCQSKPDFNLTSGGRVYRFISEGVFVNGFRPWIKGFTHQPPTLKTDYTSTLREKITVTIQDTMDADDSFDDDYLDSRVNQTLSSTYMKRWLVRNQAYNNRPAVFRIGYRDGALFVETMRFNLRVDSVKLNKNGTVTLTLKDGIKIKEDDAALAPRPSDILLTADVNASDNVLAINEEIEIFDDYEPWSPTESYTIGAKVSIGTAPNTRYFRARGTVVNASPGGVDYYGQWFAGDPTQSGNAQIENGILKLNSIPFVHGIKTGDDGIQANEWLNVGDEVSVAYYPNGLTGERVILQNSVTSAVFGAEVTVNVSGLPATLPANSVVRVWSGVEAFFLGLNPAGDIAQWEEVIPGVRGDLRELPIWNPENDYNAGDRVKIQLGGREFYFYATGAEVGATNIVDFNPSAADGAYTSGNVVRRVVDGETRYFRVREGLTPEKVDIARGDNYLGAWFGTSTRYIASSIATGQLTLLDFLRSSGVSQLSNTVTGLTPAQRENIDNALFNNPNAVNVVDLNLDFQQAVNQQGSVSNFSEVQQDSDILGRVQRQQVSAITPVSDAGNIANVTARDAARFNYAARTAFNIASQTHLARENQIIGTLGSIPGVGAVASAIESFNNITGFNQNTAFARAFAGRVNQDLAEILGQENLSNLNDFFGHDFGFTETGELQGPDSFVGPPAGLAPGSGQDDEDEDGDDGDDGGFCFITTATLTSLRSADDNHKVLKAFRKFRDSAVPQSDIKHYYAIAPRIVKAIGDDDEEYKRIWNEWLRAAYIAIQLGQKHKAYIIYKDMVMSLTQKHITGVSA